MLVLWWIILAVFALLEAYGVADDKGGTASVSGRMFAFIVSGALLAPLFIWSYLYLKGR